MESRHESAGSRRVLVGTAYGTMEGELALGPQLRTLDYLNKTTRFMSLNAARKLSPLASVASRTVHVNIDSIFWVAEVETMRRSGGAASRSSLARSAVRFCFPTFEIHGFLHTPVQGDPFARLNQERSSFIAVTSASIIGSETERAAAFLAVNSQQVFTAELIADDDAIGEAASAFEESTP